MPAEIVARPWWVNLLILIPFAAYFAWRRPGLALAAHTLTVAGVFGIAFGFVESSVLVYLRVAVGLLPGYQESLSKAAHVAAPAYTQGQLLIQAPATLLSLEVAREAGTIIMLLTVALLAAKGWRERSAIFLWMFAAWDIFYYVGSWLSTRWPPSLGAPDVLFLIPVPWFAPVWFPVTVSALTMVAIALVSRHAAGTRGHAQ